MNSIQIDDEVLAELSRRATEFRLTENDVLRRILDLPTASDRQPLATPILAVMPPPAPVALTLPEFIQSDRFKRYNQAVDRYLVILSWLHAAHTTQFAEAALGFQRGRRLYFAKSEKEVLQSGDGITAKQIPKSPFWALTTLDNKSKRIVLEDVLRALGYSGGDTELVLAQLPDSGIRRNHSRSLSLLASIV